MKPALLVIRRRRLLGKKALPDTYHAIVDSENPKLYPANFVCMLPQDPKSYLARPSYMPEFVKLFRDESLYLAVQMLHSALVKEHDPNSAKDIQKLLRKLTAPQEILMLNASWKRAVCAFELAFEITCKTRYAVQSR